MKIIFLGRLADAVGERERDIDLPLGIADVEALRGWLSGDYPALLDPGVRLVVNDVLARRDQTVSTDDEVAFFPPVSGG